MSALKSRHDAALRTAELDQQTTKQKMQKLNQQKSLKENKKEQTAAANARLGGGEGKRRSINEDLQTKKEIRSKSKKKDGEKDNLSKNVLICRKLAQKRKNTKN